MEQGVAPGGSAGEALGIAERLFAAADRADFCGYDPFDALNSRLFRYSALGRIPLARLAWLQLNKRSPINLRWIAGVPRSRNPKGAALFVLGLFEDFHDHSDQRLLARGWELGDWLLASAVDRTKWGGLGWGYNFDWQARAFYVPRGTPNAIVTCFVSRALGVLGQFRGGERFSRAALEAAEFLDRRFYRHDGPLTFYQYIPGENVLVHNASLWVAAIVAKAAAESGDRAMAARAESAARQSVSLQAADGSWPYGNLGHHRFIDGFHTGYNLEALSLIDAASGQAEFEPAIRRGLRFYEANLFLADGTAKYYHDRAYPLDTHSFAQALVTLSRLSHWVSDRQLIDRVYAAGIRDLYLPRKGRFAYQRTPTFVNGVDYLRWSQAWAYYALRVYAATIMAAAARK